MAKSADIPSLPAPPCIEFWVLSRRAGLTTVPRKDAFWRQFEARTAALAPLNERRAAVGEAPVTVQIHECGPTVGVERFGHGLTHVRVDPTLEPRFVSELRNPLSFDGKFEVHERADFPLTLSEFEAVAIAKTQCSNRASSERWLELELAAERPRQPVIAALRERAAKRAAMSASATGPDGIVTTTSGE